MDEIWKPIPGYELSYQVSSHGRVRSLTRKRIVQDCHGCMSFRTDIGRIIKDHSNGSGKYRYVSLRNGSSRKNFYVHRLVAECFCHKRPGCDYVDHIDHDRTNNVAHNLRWVTQKENVAHSADQMRRLGPRRNTRLPSTGEKYVRKKQRHGKTYYEVVVYHGKYIGKFKNIDDAITARNEVMPGA